MILNYVLGGVEWWSTGTIKLTESNFETNVMGSNEMWLVAFDSLSSPKDFKPEMDQAARELSGKIYFGKTSSEVLAGQYEVKSFPKIIYFPADKSDPMSYEKYEGDIIAKDIVTWALKKHDGEPTGKYT